MKLEPRVWSVDIEHAHRKADRVYSGTMESLNVALSEPC